MASAYLTSLLSEKPEVGERYHQKIKIVGGLDPFTLKQEDLDYSIDGVPPVTNMDIVSYLLLTHSYYTKEQMKAFKSLDSYKYFESGFVLKVGTKIINDLYIVVGQVKHSQRANLKPLDVWVIVAADGSISTAHCSCMAGLSEVCSHVGAILFAAEYATKIKEGISCTDIKAVWPMPSNATVPIVPVRNMNFGKPSSEEEKKYSRSVCD